MEDKRGALSFEGQQQKYERRQKERKRTEGNAEELGDVTRPQRNAWRNELVKVAQTNEEYLARLEAAMTEEEKDRVEREGYVNRLYGNESKSLGRKIQEGVFGWVANSSALEPYEKTLSEIRRNVCEEIGVKLVRDTGYSMPGNRRKTRGAKATASSTTTMGIGDKQKMEAARNQLMQQIEKNKES